jgi:sec-independent protein translocase protein TatB
VRQAELDELRKQVEQARSFNLNQELEKAIDPDGKLREPLGGPADGTAKPVDAAKPALPDPEEDADMAAIALPPAGAPPVTPLEPAPVASPAAAVQVEPVLQPLEQQQPLAPSVEPAIPVPVSGADDTKPVEAPKTQGERP